MTRYAVVIMLFLFGAGDQGLVNVKLPVSTLEKHFSSTVCFAKKITSTISSFPKEALSTEIEGNKLIIKLHSKAEGFVDVFCEDGTFYKIRVSPSTEEEFTPIVNAVRAFGISTEKQDVKKIEAIELLKMMRMGEKDTNMLVLEADGVEVYNSSTFNLKLCYIYITENLKGYILKAENIASEKIKIDPARFCSEALVLVATEDIEIEPGGFTYLYLVFAI